MFKIFAFYDKKAVRYFPPFYLHNKGLALRYFGEIANDVKTEVCKYPEDYSIWILGEWNEVTGEIICLKKPEFLEEALNVKKESNNGDA